MSTTTIEIEQLEVIEPTLENADPTHRSALEAEEPEHNVDDRLDRLTYMRLLAAGFSFFVAGVNDGSIGALIPYIIREHNINTAIVSSVYGANFFGWLTAALMSTHLVQYLDLGAMLVLGALLQIVAHALRAWNPPFSLFAVTFWLVSVGQAFQDTHANTFVAGLKGNHRWLAFIHAMYSGGCLVGPFVATPIASAGRVSRWYFFYLFPLGIGVVNLIMTALAFRSTLSIKGKSEVNNTETAGRQPREGDPSKNKDATNLVKKTLTNRSVWLVCLFFFFYLGTILTAGGWVVEYLVEVRNGDLSQMGYVPAGFNGGSLVGRLLLAEPIHRFGSRRMVFIFCILALALQLIFWHVPNIIAASIALSFMGFFLGPFFATGVSVGSKLFPSEIYSTALSFVFVFAQMGGCMLPIVTGLIAANSGVAILQPILVGILVITTVTWLLVPKPKSSDNPELHQE